MISIPPSDSLLPHVHPLANGRKIFFFPSATELVKIDLLSEAGSAYQEHPLVAAAANKLFTVAGGTMDAEQLADFMDFRGIIVENNNTALQSTATFYTLSRHLDALLPVMDALVHSPSFPEREFDIYRRERKQKILASQQKSPDVARRLFYEALFGFDHPLGTYAVPEDADRLILSDIKKHYATYHKAGGLNIVLSGHIDDSLLAAMENLCRGTMPATDKRKTFSFKGLPCHANGRQKTPLRSEAAIPGAVQATIRIGRVLPLAWNDADYAQLMLLVTLLGGYFGSRLMSNLREDKGYTYGIYARTQIYRGVIVFFITADVAGSAVDDAEKEIIKELQRLVEEPVADEELELVRTVLAGDFLRSVDGIFERSTRFIDMLGTDLDERFTDNLRTALATTTPAVLQRLAAAYLSPDAMTVCRAGAL